MRLNLVAWLLLTRAGPHQELCAQGPHLQRGVKSARLITLQPCSLHMHIFHQTELCHCFQAVLGVSVADDIDSTKSANSDFRESPNTPSQLNSFPHTPCSSSLLSEQNPLQQPQQQRSAHRRLFSGVNPLLGTFPDANLPPLLAPSERSLSSFPSVPPSSFLSLGSLGQSRANGHHRTNSMPLPLDEHLWGAPQASKGTQRLPAYLSQQVNSSA